MTKQLLDDVRAQRRDAPGVERLRAIDTQTIRELQPISPPTYAKNCSGLALPLTSYTGLSDAELRIAHAQLMGWLEGLFKTMQPAVSSPDLAPATATSSSDSLFYRHEHLLQHQAPRKQALARRGGDAPGAGNYMAAVGESQLAATGENNWPSLGRTN